MAWFTKPAEPSESITPASTPMPRKAALSEPGMNGKAAVIANTQITVTTMRRVASAVSASNQGVWMRPCWTAPKS
jgi:hypothetical protein